MVHPCISRTTSEHFQSKRLGLECVPKHKEHTSSKISRRIFIPSCDRKKKKMKNEIQIGLEIQNSNLSALVYTVVCTAAAMVYTVVYTAAAAGIYRGIYCGITTVQKVFVAILTILILPKTTSVCILLEPCSP